MKGLNINYSELLQWEIEQDRKIAQRLFEEKRRVKNPNEKKKYEQKRKQLRSKHFFEKEEVWVKKITRKKFRRDWKKERNSGKWHRPVNREYRTYGWITW